MLDSLNNSKLDIIQSDAGLVADVRSMIEQTRKDVAQTVNAGITLLYWRIGKRIQTDVLGNQRAEYGQEIVATLGRQLGWSHFKELLQQKLHAAIKSARTRFES